MARRSKTDFLDNDLVQQRDKINEVKIGPANEPGPSGETSEGGDVPVRDLNLTALRKKKEEVNTELASKMEELEKLRSRHESLQREKDTLEHLRKDQEKYEDGKQEILQELEQCTTLLEREDLLLNKRLELITETRKRFNEMLEELHGLKEDEWPDEGQNFRDELTKAITIIENTRKEYHKAISRLEATRETAESAPESEGLSRRQEDEGALGRGFGHWLLIGFAVSLPLLFVFGILIAVLIFRRPII